jgi:sodium/potassium-transporting ATPase subunit alpha
MRMKYGHIRATVPFDPENRFSVTALESPDRKGTISIYLKGAPEDVIEMCNKAMSSGVTVPIIQNH